MTDFRRLTIGPTIRTISYNSYCINGYLFYTADAEKHLTTQNSRVTMNACTIFRESSGDTNLVDDDTTYYDVLKKILELDYGVFTEVVFYCDWARFEDKVHGSYVDRETKLRFVNFEKFARSSKEEDEPFIHASQASQVFYRSDLTRKHWNLVFESPIRSHPHMNAFEDPYVFTATSSDVPLISETIEDDDYWSGIAQGDDEYSDVDDQELALAECADDEYSDGDA
ncbi:uncharacterized protein LOC113300619 [Papaver somniferum]|uniref:uncharacterized protein LOC113300619 n=1 Tax=Papaver somniferum TaxID=3469 RepID=UPI000E6FA26E|nr:uncharacterized protein LOC113300619 [Papaver somniferum]